MIEARKSETKNPRDRFPERDEAKNVPNMLLARAQSAREGKGSDGQSLDFPSLRFPPPLSPKGFQ